MTEMEDAAYIDLIAKYLSGNLEAQEKQELMAWVEASEANKVYFDEMIQLWSISDNYEEQFDTNLDTAWTSLNQKLPKAEVALEKTGKVVSIGIWMRVAAAVIVLAGVGLWWYTNTPTTIIASTLEGEQKTIELPDGSTVTLNELTTLSYNSDFETRDVNLEGEAFFDVDRQEENPFTIFSGKATTTVLGTSFNVRAYPEEEAVEVTVKTGKVAFKQDTEEASEEIYLEAGKSGIYNKEAQTIEEVVEEQTNADAWNTKALAFPNLRMEEVIKTLQRYYDLEIDVSDAAIENCRFYMDREEDPDLQNIWGYMEFSMGYKVEEKGNNAFVINGKGCN